MFWNSSYTTITGNRILNNLAQGIGFGGHIGTYYNQHNLITQNVFSGNNVAMAPIEDGDLINSVITQNQIIGNNGGLGIGTEGHSWINVTISYNVIADSLGDAIFFVGYKKWDRDRCERTRIGTILPIAQQIKYPPNILL